MTRKTRNDEQGGRARKVSFAEFGQAVAGPKGQGAEDFIDLGGGLRVPRRLPPITIVDHPDLPYDLEMEAELQNGQMVCTSVAIRQRADGEPVTTDRFRRIPLSGIVRHEVHKAVADVASADMARLYGMSADELRQRGMSDPDALRAVAAAYRLAHLCGDPPNVTVAAQLEASRATAGRWISKARELGYLGAATGRRPGEERD